MTTIMALFLHIRALFPIFEKSQWRPPPLHSCSYTPDLPRIQDVTDNFEDNQFFSLLDQTKGYHQLHLDPESRWYTALTTSREFYELIWVSFGLMGAVACLRRFMKQCLDDYRDDLVIPYLNDLLILPFLLDEDLQHLKLVFQRLKQFDMKIKASKCKLFCREISYLGGLVSSEGYTADPKNVLAEASKINKKLKTISELWTLFGLTGYFRRYTPNFSKTASPIYQLLKGQPKNHIKHWLNGEKHQSAINNLLNQITNPPPLA